MATPKTKDKEVNFENTRVQIINTLDALNQQIIAARESGQFVKDFKRYRDLYFKLSKAARSIGYEIKSLQPKGTSGRKPQEVAKVLFDPEAKVERQKPPTAPGNSPNKDLFDPHKNVGEPVTSKRINNPKPANILSNLDAETSAKESKPKKTGEKEPGGKVLASGSLNKDKKD